MSYCVLLSITSINFWEITTARTSKKWKLNQAFSRLRLECLFWQATSVLWQVPRPIEKSLVNIVPDNQICKMIQHIDSVETLLLKYKNLNI